jgi:hypothetical protein
MPETGGRETGRTLESMRSPQQGIEKSKPCTLPAAQSHRKRPSVNMMGIDFPGPRRGKAARFPRVFGFSVLEVCALQAALTDTAGAANPRWKKACGKALSRPAEPESVGPVKNGHHCMYNMPDGEHANDQHNQHSHDRQQRHSFHFAAFYPLILYAYLSASTERIVARFPLIKSYRIYFQGIREAMPRNNKIIRLTCPLS